MHCSRKKILRARPELKVIHFSRPDEQPELDLENDYPNKAGRNLKKIPIVPGFYLGFFVWRGGGGGGKSRF